MLRSGPSEPRPCLRFISGQRPLGQKVDQLPLLILGEELSVWRVKIGVSATDRMAVDTTHWGTFCNSAFGVKPVREVLFTVGASFHKQSSTWFGSYLQLVEPPGACRAALDRSSSGPGGRSRPAPV